MMYINQGNKGCSMTDSSSSGSLLGSLCTVEHIVTSIRPLRKSSTYSNWRVHRSDPLEFSDTVHVTLRTVICCCERTWSNNILIYAVTSVEDGSYLGVCSLSCLTCCCLTVTSANYDSLVYLLFCCWRR